MTYEKYLDYSREELLEKVRAVMSLNASIMFWVLSELLLLLLKSTVMILEKAGLAGLLHDYAKELPDQEFLELIDKYELDPALKNWGNNVWHGMVGIYKIQEDLGLTDPEILRSIEIHTRGHEMSTLDKIVYVADYIEHNRNFPLVEEARQVAEQSLDKAVAFETVHTVEHLAHQAFADFPANLGNL